MSAFPAMSRRALALLCLFVAAATARADDAPPLSTGRSLYLAIYSHLYHGDLDGRGNPSQTLLSAHVSIRNTDARSTIKVVSARYYDTEGRLVKDYVPAPRTIKPLGTLELFVPHTDVSGGSGANFIIEWKADGPVNPPLAEALHADIRASRTIVFTTTARTLAAP